MAALRRLPRDRLLERARAQPAHLPEVRIPFPHRRAGTDRAAHRRGTAEDPVRRGRARRSARLRRHQALRRPPEGLPESARRRRRGDRRGRFDRNAADRARGDGLPLHGRIDGLGRRREAHPRRRVRARAETPAGHRLRLRRRAHAGGHPLAHADGQDLGCVDAPARGRSALHLCAYRPHDRRRDGVLRHARRPEHRRARSAHRLRRPARPELKSTLARCLRHLA